MKWFAILAAVAVGLALAPSKSDKDKDKVKEHRVRIDDLKYEPARLRVRAGDAVVWINEDDRDHTVVCKDKDKSFNSGKIAAKGKFKFVFKKPGRYEYGCSYHPRMKAVVEVTE